MQVAAPAGVAAPRHARSLSDAGAALLALATAAGAWSGVAVPVGVAATVVVLAFVLRRPAVLVVGAALLASALSARATAGLTPPAPGPFQGEVTLAGDPASAPGMVKAEARVGARRVELRAGGVAGAVVEDHLAGERIVVRGRLGPLPEAAQSRLSRRHVSARLEVAEAVTGRPAAMPQRLANSLRRSLATGARSLGEERPLFLGMVIGDDREQSEVVADDFRAAGLTHLLAVSGQNVAFVMVLAGPLLRRLGLRSRWVATVALICFFALLTRFEPSVLRASAMAAVACTAFGLGRPASRCRILSLAVTAVLLLDPFLVRSVGFLLSVGASTGIVLLARPVADRIPGPRWVAELVGVTVAAQVGVAPVLLPVFGGVPLASLPANVLAVPAAGPLMVWGLTAGMAAGVLGPPFDAWLHLPTGWLTGWVAAVARWAAGLPLGELDAPGALAVAGVVLLGAALHRWRPAAVAPVTTAAVVALLLVPPVLPRPPLHGADGGNGVVTWRDGGAVVVVVDDLWLPGVLAELRRARVDRIDVLVLRRGGRRVAGAVVDLRSRVEVRLVLAPPGHRVRDAEVPPLGAFTVGALQVAVTDLDPALEVSVRRHRRAPP